MSIFNKAIHRFSLKPSNVRVFLFFLGCTSLLWILIQFSKNYTREIEVNIAYQELPKGMLLNANSDTTVKLLLQGNGFRLFKYAWNTPLLIFNMSDAIPYEEDQYYFLFEKQKEFIKHKLALEGQIVSVQSDTIKVILDESLVKKVPIVVTTDIHYADGYGSGDGVHIQPDSITISGPKGIIDTIHKIKTDDLTLNDLKANYTTTLALGIQDLTSLQYTPSQVTASITVSKFTEGRLEIPIQLRNVPKGKNIKIFPKKVTVVYKVALHEYNKVSLKDFTIVADYNSRTDERSFIMLELIQSPLVAHDIKIQERQVQYVVLK